jgi:hypothetical protein
MKDLGSGVCSEVNSVMFLYTALCIGNARLERICAPMFVNVVCCEQYAAIRT